MSLKACNVCLKTGGKRILHNVSVDILPGQLTALIGPNGAGKSTLLKVLSGDILPDQGEVWLQNKPLQQISVATQAQMRSVMAQSTSITFDFSVDDILRMGWVSSLENFDTALASIINACDLQHLLRRTFNTLSGGEQRRVHFARALLQIWQPEAVQTPRYLLLDEPTANLDLAHELMLLKLARQQAIKGIGVLIVLHDLNLTARFADNVLLLANGEAIAQGSPSQVLQPDRLTDIYQTPIRVERHEQLNRLVILT